MKGKWTLTAICALGFVLSGASRAAPPGEVQDLTFATSATLTWSAAAGADFHNVYRGDLDGADGSEPARCHGQRIAGINFDTPTAPDPGRGFFYLATGESSVDGEGTAGSDSSLQPRPVLGRCTPVMRSHVQNRLGFGENPWTRQRI